MPLVVSMNFFGFQASIGPLPLHLHAWKLVEREGAVHLPLAHMLGAGVAVWSLPLHLHAWKLVEREVWRLAGILDPYSPSYSGKTLEEPSVILNARR